MDTGKIFKDFVLILGLSTVLFLLIEGALRLIYPEKIITSKDSSILAYEFDKDFLVTLKANVSKTFKRKEENGGYISHWKTNSDSFRGEEINGKSNFRVIVYGDSNVQARFSGKARTFTEQLSGYLTQKKGHKVEVLNAGVVGFGPDQSLIRFNRELKKYKPDLVVFHVFADNDFGDIVRNRLFELDSKDRLVAVKYKKKPDIYLQESEENLWKRNINNLLVIRLVKKLLAIGGSSEDKKKTVLKEEQINKERDKLISVLISKVDLEYLVYKNSKPKEFSHFMDHYDIDVALFPTRESSLLKINLMAKILKKASDLAKKENIDFYVLIEPSVIDLTTANATLNYNYLSRYKDYKPTNLSSTVEKICNDNGIKALNLFNIYKENNPENLYFKAGDDHWTDSGQNLAARELAKFIFNKTGSR